MITQATAVCKDCHGSTVINETAILKPAKHFQSGPPRAEVSGPAFLSLIGQHYNEMRQGDDSDLQHSTFILMVSGRPVGMVTTSYEDMLAPIPMQVNDRGVENILTQEFLGNRGVERR